MNAVASAALVAIVTSAVTIPVAVFVTLRYVRRKKYGPLVGGGV